VLLVAFHEEFGKQPTTLKALALVSGALLSFAAGYPFAVIVGIVLSLWPPLMNAMTIPRPDEGTAAEIKCFFGDEAARDLLGCVSVLHHTVLEPQTLSFLSRRLNNFYVAINTVLASLGAIMTASLLGKCADNRVWVAFVIGGSVLIGHAIMQIFEHRRLCSLIYPVLMLRLREASDKQQGCSE